MQTLKIGKHTVEMYDTIDALPIVRFHKYQKMLLVDSGIGADIASFDKRIERVRRYMLTGKAEQAAQELANLRQCVYLIQQGINPEHRAFAVLVSSIDGDPCTDLSDDGITATLARLGDAPAGEIAASLGAVKKKIDDELSTYFPGLFEGVEIKEYYDIVKQRAMAILREIIAGEQEPGKGVEELTTQLILYSKPKEFAGPEGVEVQSDRQFENLCLALSAELHIEPKACTVLEFYNAFDFLREKSKREEKAAKEARRRR